MAGHLLDHLKKQLLRLSRVSWALLILLVTVFLRSADRYNRVIHWEQVDARLMLRLYDKALRRKPIPELRSVTCHMWSQRQSVTATRHRLTRPALTPARHASQATLYLFISERWKAELISALVIQVYWDGLPVRGQSPIQVLTAW